MEESYLPIKCLRRFIINPFKSYSALGTLELIINCTCVDKNFGKSMKNMENDMIKLKN